MIRASHIITVMVVLLILPGMVWGFNTEVARKTLEGINEISVVVESMGPEIERDGLTKSQIQTDVEMKLRMTGLNVLTFEKVSKVSGSPWIYVKINIGKTSRGAYVFNINLELMQNVYLERYSKRSIASTWSVEYFGITPNLDDIRSKTRGLVDDFRNAWVSVNLQ